MLYNLDMHWYQNISLCRSTNSIQACVCSQTRWHSIPFHPLVLLGCIPRDPPPGSSKKWESSKRVFLAHLCSKTRDFCTRKSLSNLRLKLVTLLLLNSSNLQGSNCCLLLPFVQSLVAFNDAFKRWSDVFVVGPDLFLEFLVPTAQGLMKVFQVLWSERETLQDLHVLYSINFDVGICNLRWSTWKHIPRHAWLHQTEMLVQSGLPRMNTIAIFPRSGNLALSLGSVKRQQEGRNILTGCELTNASKLFTRKIVGYRKLSLLLRQGSLCCFLLGTFFIDFRAMFWWRIHGGVEV